MNYLTLAEMAARHRKTPKVFARLVRSEKLPYLPANKKNLRGALFDPVAVEAHLSALVPDNVVSITKTVRKSTAKKSRFAEEVGL